VDKRDTKISKFLSFLLRHGVEEFDISHDEHGYAPIESIMKILRARYKAFGIDDLLRIAHADPKGRYEIDGDRIRARYGHSVSVTARAAPECPPEVLYHGTASRNVSLILRDGLRPMRRQYVHLSAGSEDAVSVGRRHSRKVVILRVRAADAHRAGVEFLKEAGVYLARHVPAEFIELLETDQPPGD